MQSPSSVLAAFDAGKAALPAVTLAFEVFRARAVENDVSDRDLAANAADLYLAYACGEGDAAALRLFEERFIANVDLYTSRAPLSPEMRAEVRQKVRVKLLVGRPPAIARFGGRGPLTALVRVTAVRIASDVATAVRGRRQRSDEDVLDMLESADTSPEVNAARALYRDRFREALAESLAALPPREKTLMRLHFVDGLNLDGIGVIYRVHRATVARWLVAIRNKVFADLRKRLSLQLGSSPSELRSLVQLLRDDIDISARRILAADPS
jgi:RNA polymerase sigma-70 factor (ECF subfamily)